METLFDSICKMQLVESYYFCHGKYNIFLDVNRSNFYSIEDKYLDVIKVLKKEENMEVLKQKYSKDDIETVIKELIEQEILVRDSPEYEILSVDREKEVINLVMNISQDCNLRCTYCFASTGHYKGKRTLMSKEVADKTLTWFFEQAKCSKVLNLHLFGGEPLINIPLVEYIVEKCKILEKEYSKKIFINVCTNGTILNEKLLKLIKDNEIGMQISIDGPKEVHDKYRPMANGNSSYDKLAENMSILFEELDKNTIIPRGTISNAEVDVNDIVKHIIEEMGFNAFFFIPAMGTEGQSYDNKDLPKYFEQYDKLVETFLDKLRKGEEYNIYPFVTEVDAIGKGVRRIYGCGAGIGFTSVDIKGDIYPCMRFTNNKEYLIGNIEDGFNENRDKLFERTVYNRTKCKKCWARHFCGGACIAIPVENGESMNAYNENTCEVSKHMIELAMYANTVISDENLKFNKEQLKVNDFMRRRFQ